jgi:hypothetical protein
MYMFAIAVSVTLGGVVYKYFDIDFLSGQAGLLAGEGLGGVCQALLAVIGIDGGSEFSSHAGITDMD